MTELELYHHGIKGQKWGVRRYEDSSGHLTAAGKQRYGDDTENTKKSTTSSYKTSSKSAKSSVSKSKSASTKSGNTSSKKRKTESTKSKGVFQKQREYLVKKRTSRAAIDIGGKLVNSYLSSKGKRTISDCNINRAKAFTTSLLNQDYINHYWD